MWKKSWYRNKEETVRNTCFFCLQWDHHLDLSSSVAASNCCFDCCDDVDDENELEKISFFFLQFRKSFIWARIIINKKTIGKAISAIHRHKLIFGCFRKPVDSEASMCTTQQSLWPLHPSHSPPSPPPPSMISDRLLQPSPRHSAPRRAP